MKLTEIVADVLGVTPDLVADSTRPGDLENWDSLRHVHLIMRLEKHYRISFDYSDLTRLNSVGDIRSTLHEKGMETGTAPAAKAGTRNV